MSAIPQRRVLAVDDDRRLCAALGRILADEGYAFRSAQDGMAMRRALADERFDLVLLDLGFPSGEDGITLARSFRMQHEMPLIMLSGKDSTFDKVVCLEIGADDYVTKPFEPRELVARIRTVLRRYGRQASAPETESDDVWRFAGWCLDAGAQSLTSPDGTPVRLTEREFRVLEALVSRSGRVLSREQILDLVAHRRWGPYDRSIDVLVAKLRRKLNVPAGESELIRTVRGIGYMFVPSPGARPASESARGK